MRARFAVALTLALSACTALPPAETASFLDESTGVTLVVVQTPIVLARERRDAAANARDYVTLVAAERNLMGKRSLALVAHRWSTIDPRLNIASDQNSRLLVLVADGRDIRLTPIASSLPREFANAEQLRRPPVSEVSTTAYVIDYSALDYLAKSKRVAAFYVADHASISFDLWTDGRAALRDFLDTVGAPHAR